MPLNGVERVFYLLFVFGFTVMSGMAFSGNLNFDSYFVNFNSSDDIGTAAGFYSPTTPYKLVDELLNGSTRLTTSISEVKSSLGWSGSYMRSLSPSWGKFKYLDSSQFSSS